MDAVLGLVWWWHAITHRDDPEACGPRWPGLPGQGRARVRVDCVPDPGADQCADPGADPGTDTTAGMRGELLEQLVCLL